MTLAIDMLSWAFILGGSFFTLVGALGLVRMPELYSRIHAASITDTLGLGLLAAGMMLQAGFTLVTVKLLFLVILFVFTTPVITHALAQAALYEKIPPLLAEDRRNREAVAARGSEPDGRPS